MECFNYFWDCEFGKMFDQAIWVGVACFPLLFFVALGLHQVEEESHRHTLARLINEMGEEGSVIAVSPIDYRARGRNDPWVIAASLTPRPCPQCDGEMRGNSNGDTMYLRCWKCAHVPAPQWSLASGAIVQSR
jgi:hypothetical protein